jgi:hypothetical protein
MAKYECTHGTADYNGIGGGRAMGLIAYLDGGPLFSQGNRAITAAMAEHQRMIPDSSEMTGEMQLIPPYIEVVCPEFFNGTVAIAQTNRGFAVAETPSPDSPKRNIIFYQEILGPEIETPEDLLAHLSEQPLNIESMLGDAEFTVNDQHLAPMGFPNDLYVIKNLMASEEQAPILINGFKKAYQQLINKLEAQRDR